MTSRDSNFTAQQFVARTFLQSLPPELVKSVCEWARKNVRLIGSARSEAYDPDITPWTKAPIECANDGTRRLTFIKPVQSGGSAAGEVALCFWMSIWNGGDVAYYWQNDEKVSERWKMRVDKILRNCKAAMARTSLERFQMTNGMILFPHANFVMRGANTPRNVASDSFRGIVTEEMHDVEGGWHHGRYQQVINRTTAFWNSVIFNISNAGPHGSELHGAWEGGTQQHWQVKCPGCHQMHVMRTKWEDDKPHLGGLRYDQFDKVNGEYNYTRIKQTCRIQMPCGFPVYDDIQIRRQLSLSGEYGEPQNKSASETEKSFTLEAVSVDYIPLLDLVKEKHRGLKALKMGDSKPFFDYLRERECKFTNPEDRPIVQRIVLSTRKKNRDGLPNRTVRFGQADRQQGSVGAGESPYWWATICDVELLSDGKIHFLLVYEGKILTDAELVKTFSDHTVKPSCVVVDSGWDSRHVYELCFANGYNAIKGEDTLRFPHDDGGQKIFSQERYLHTMMNCGPMEGRPDIEEPLYWLYSTVGIKDRLAFLRTSDMVKFEIPADVSEAFHSHMDAWTFDQKKVHGTGEIKPQWRQSKVRDDLYICLCYNAMQMEMAALIGDTSSNQKEKK